MRLMLVALLLGLTAGSAAAKPADSPEWTLCLTKKGIPVDQAIEACTKVIAASANSDDSLIDAYIERGNRYRQKDAYELAIVDFDAASRLDPKYAPPYYHLGNAYADKGDQERAIAEYGKAIELRANYADAYFNRGYSYFDTGAYDKSIADYNRVIALTPDDANAFQMRGMGYEVLGQFDRATSDFDSAVQLKPDDPRANYSRGYHAFVSGSFDAAIADEDAAIALDPDYAFAYRTRGNAKFNQGKFAEAIADFSKLASLNPDDAYALIWLYITSERAHLDGRDALLRAAKSPEKADGRMPIINLLLGTTTPEAVLTAADKASPEAYDVQHCEANFYIGEALLLRGDAAAAKPWFEAALGQCTRLDIEYVTAKTELARLQ